MVTNAGTTTLTSVGVTDPTAGPVSCPLTSLTPGLDDDVHGGRAHRSPRPTSTPVSSTTPRPRRPRTSVALAVVVEPVVDVHARRADAGGCS